MEILQTYYQLKDDLTFEHAYEAYSKPFSAVCIAPPEADDGYVAIWNTVLDPVLSVDFGNADTGEWSVVQDHRTKELYEKINGNKYDITKNDSVYKGLGPIPDYLTETVRPSDDHVWKDNGWWIDPEIEQQRLNEVAAAAADVKLKTELADANQNISYLSDAVELEIATEDEKSKYNEWRKYRVLLTRVPEQTDYPTKIDWPERPDT